MNDLMYGLDPSTYGRYKQQHAVESPHQVPHLDGPHAVECPIIPLKLFSATMQRKVDCVNIPLYLVHVEEVHILLILFGVLGRLLIPCV